MPSKERALEQATREVRRNLQRASDRLAEQGLPKPALDGKALRPLAAYALVSPEDRQSLDERFWFGALAIEMVHEASLLHDDILDEASERRGKPTMAAAAGVGPALVLGDHLLTGAYRAAAATKSPEFLEIFIRAVERTVAGEIAQEKSQGKVLDEAEYTNVITGKSGELFRCAFALAPSLLGTGCPDRFGALGARFGALYQRVDDFLDYCTAANRGKTPLQDYRQNKWTWPLALIQVSDFEFPSSEIRARLFQRPAEGGSSVMETGADELQRRFQLLLGEIAAEGAQAPELADLLTSWSRLIRESAGEEALTLQIQTPAPPLVAERVLGETRNPPVGTASLRRDLRLAGEGLETAEGRLRYFSHHAKTFRFAARLFPKAQLQKVADVYAFCRFTDDLVDEASDDDVQTIASRLDVWLFLARKAYHGGDSGIPFLDAVMSETRNSDVPFSYAEDLIAGMRMDLAGTRYRTLDDLRLYSYRVASVVGGWLTELFGVRDPWVLEGAFALGHAMQLTNILRDVGEDLADGRLYLPQDRMERHGIDVEFLNTKRENGSPIVSGYKELLEKLMADADADYERAFESIPALPRFFQGPVAVAASVYRGIHDEIRKNGYDNLTRRASTSLPRKVLLAWKGLRTLREVGARQALETADGTVPMRTFRNQAEGRAAS